MFRPILICGIIISLLALHSLAPAVPAQMTESVASEHIRMRLPFERISLGRDVVAELERCYLFMNRSTDGSLPRKVLIVADWETSEVTCNVRAAAIVVGMKSPAADADSKRYLLHNAAREMARLGLIGLSGGARREDTEFLMEGMAEILAHDYEHSTRSLEAAWVISQYLDQMQLLGLAPQRAWSQFSSGRSNLRSAAPGITFLTTFRDLQGRDKPIKFFQALKRNNIIQSLSSAFKFAPGELEPIWLRKVREYNAPDEITISAEDAPQLTQSTAVPHSGPPHVIQLQLFFRDRTNDLTPEGVFIKDERTGRVTQAQPPTEKGAVHLTASLQVDDGTSPGKYFYEVTAIDEAGNLRRWKRDYVVGDPAPRAGR